MNLTDLYDAILNGKLDRAVAVTNEAISEGVLPNEIITNYMIKAMEEFVSVVAGVSVVFGSLVVASVVLLPPAAVIVIVAPASDAPACSSPHV